MFGLFKKNSKSKNSDRLETDAIGCPPRSDELITGSNANDSSNEIQVYQTPNQQVAIPEQQTIAQPSVCTPMSQIQ